MPIDYSSLWQLGLLIMVYTIMRIMPAKYYILFVYLICIWGVIEAIISILQENNKLESNHLSFNVTGTFGNPGPLGGFLAICWLLIICFVYKNMQNKVYLPALLYSLAAGCIIYALLLSQSRAGWIAALIGSLFLTSSLFNKPQCFTKTKKNLLKTTISFVILSFIIVIYFLKKDSADGRLLIWNNTINMIADHPIIGMGTGGWTANYMYYQADYFSKNQVSAYTMLADNAFYPYNEFLHITVEQGIVGLLLVGILLYVLFSRKEYNNIDRLLKVILLAFLTFSFFSYPGDVFLLKLLFVGVLGLMKSDVVKRIFISSTKIYILGSVLFLCITCVSIWSYYIHNKAFSKICKLAEKENVSESDLLSLKALYPFFCYNPQLMNTYSQTCIDIYPPEKKILILQDAINIAPTCELYYEMGDLWKENKDFTQSEKCYRMAVSMIPHRVTPQYKLFQFYVGQGNKNAAFHTGNILLKQSVKKEGTKTLRMKAEVYKYLHENK